MTLTVTTSQGRGTKITNLYNALLKAQQSYPKLLKDSTNPHFKNDYLSLDGLLEEILPVLNENGVILVQAPCVIGADNEPGLQTNLIHAESGDQIGNQMVLVLDKDTSQGQGSAITYARRYSLMSMLGLAASNDDDAESASSKPKVKRKPKSTPQTDADGSGDGFDF